MNKEAALKEYVRKRFHTEGKPLGEHGRALLVETEGFPLVVKTLVSQGKWKRYVWARDLLDTEGVNVPQNRLPPEFLPNQGLYLVFEEYLPGEPLSALKKPTGSTMEEVSKAVLAIHFIENDKWGVPFKVMKRRGYFKRHLRKIQRWSTGDTRLQKEISSRRWVKKLVGKLEKSVKTYQMTHGDLHGKNILLSGNKIFFVDLVRSSFGCYAKDLARLDLWERRTWGTRRIFQSYMKNLKDPLLEEKLMLFFLGEFVRRRDVDWIREDLWRLLEREELP